MSSLRFAMGVSAASSLGVEEEAVAAAGVIGVVGLGGGVFVVISPKGFRTPVEGRGIMLNRNF